MAVDFKDLTLEQMMKALPHLVAEGLEGKYVYNLEFAEVDGVRVVADKYFVVLEGGSITVGQGHSDDPEATLFTVNQGGVDTIIAFQVHGLKAATSAMIMGYIFASNIKKAEAWFKILRVGLEPVKAALAATGIEVGDTNLDLYEELMVA
jgi:hypothetical protein